MSHRSIRHRIIFTAIALVLLIAAGLPGSASAKVSQNDGKIIADLGFRPATNGFGFENYTGDIKPVNLTAVEMRRMFGDQVCARISGDTCDLTPPAQEFMRTTNVDMNGGHCEGMAVLSMLLYTGQQKPDNFGGATTVDLPLDGNDKLQREIAYWWATQGTSPTREQLVEGKTPKEILDVLIKSMQDKSEYYDIGVYQPNFKDGHALTPYAIKDMGNGVFHVMVYDNNWPKQERFIEVDTNANTWTYSASTNPDEPEEVYKGDANTKTFSLGPFSPREKQQNCDFCAANAASFKVGGLAAPALQYNEITLYSDGAANAVDLLITDAQGHRLGYQGGTLYNEIPNASFEAVTSANLFHDSPEPIYYVPTGVAFTVTLDGSALKQDEVTNISMIGPGYDLAMENINVKAGEKDTLQFSPDGSKISYTPSADEAPTIIVGLQHAGSDYDFDIAGADVQPGATINVTLDTAKGRLGVNTTGSSEQSTTYALQVDRIDASAHDTFAHAGLALDPGETAYIEFGAWDGKGDMQISIDKQSDGTIDATQTESNISK